MLLIVCCLTLAGCLSPGAAGPQEDPNIVQRLSFWQPYLLYTLDSPHPRLCVEVDAVEGCAPSERSLNKLRDFLATYCNKSGGIEIVRSDVIPIAAARGIPPTLLARTYLNGPPDNPDAPAPAFMYVLYYSGALCDASTAADANPAGEETTPRPRQRDVHPHADFLPYPAIIFMNTSYMRHWDRDEALVHEVGHLLGLAGRTTYASGYHCLSPTCLMNKYFYFSRFLLGWQRRLCKRCVTQLADSSRQPPPSNLCFVGPVLVRSEDGYHVLSLPKRMTIVVGNLTEQDCRDLAAGVRSETPSPGGDNEQLLAEVQIKGEVLSEPAKMQDIINRIKHDPYETVRGAWTQLWSDIQPEAH